MVAGGHNKISDEELLNSLKEYVETNPNIGRLEDIPRYNSYQRRFGSVVNLLLTLGIDRRPKKFEFICPECYTVFRLSANKYNHFIKVKNKTGPYCSSNCFYSYKRKSSSSFNSHENLSDRACIICGIGIGARNSKTGSRECYWETVRLGNSDREQKRIDKYLSGDYSECVNKEGQSKAWFTKYIKTQAGNRCERCGWAEANPSNGIVYVEVDHIDGDCFNSRRDNLQVLCPNCHSLTPTYKALNRGNSKRTAIYGKRV